jgi:beta-lactam-binding protein with PASTA domain
MRMAKDDLYGDSMLPDFAGMTLRQARERLAQMRLSWTSEGSGRVIRQTPAPGTPINDVAECTLVFGARTVADSHEPTRPLPANGD